MVRDSQYLFSLSSCCKQLRGLYILLLFLVFNDYCQTNYFKIYRTDLRQIFRVGRTQITFFDSSEDVATATSFGGAAGWANVGLCCASSYCDCRVHDARW